MSGIAGLYYLDGRPVEHPEIKKMTNILAHRGPDDTGLWRQGPVGLGHRMLWTTPESLHEKLPLASQRGDLVITADARIDNRAELIPLLGFSDRPAGEITDSQLVLAAYEKWGEQCPEKLIGDFAFVIWDRGKQQLFCARDPMGVKPFYYYYTNRIFVFASEIKAILSLPGAPRQLNEVKVADHLARIFEDTAITFYQGILRLPAAHSLKIASDNIRLERYWSPDLSREVRLPSDEAYAEAFLQIFSEAVKCRLRSAFPIGSTLSGGLDSSSIACTARDLLAQTSERRLHSFSAIFPNLSAEARRLLDERPYMDAVVARGGLEPHFVQADRLSPLVELDRVLWHEDEAILAPNLYMHWGLFSAAQQQGVRIFLDGVDGDSTVSHGLEYLTELVRTGRWLALASEARAYARKYQLSWGQIIWEYGFKPLLPSPIMNLSTLWRGNNQPISVIDKAINPFFARQVGLAERVQSNSAKPVYTARKRHWAELASGLNPYMLELADKAAVAFSLEMRYPFFDRRLIEFCLALPPIQKLHQGWTRVIMRRAMEGILPSEVQWRISKAQLGSNFKQRLLECDREILDGVILKEPQFIEPYVDVPTIRAAYQRYIAQPMQSNQEVLAVYTVVTLGYWLRQAGLMP